MAQAGCPECDVDFVAVWQVTVGTDPQGYKPVFGNVPVTVEAGRCNNCNMSFERVDGGPCRRQGDQ